ncbi:hypothetical protein AMECASPLE_013145 [Ameca splendens]|uniref:Uncharacterized protein n=1 Tax=Ameca splendens TaxID=208324 RepID=A0ABV0ZMB6_9TELE
MTVSCTIIHGCVLSSQIVHLQIDFTAGVISGDGESALDRLGVKEMGTACVHKSNPLQSFSRSLSDPVHWIAAECEPRGCTGQFVGFSRSFNHWFRFCQSLSSNTCQKQKSSNKTIW